MAVFVNPVTLKMFIATKNEILTDTQGDNNILTCSVLFNHRNSLIFFRVNILDWFYIKDYFS